MFDSTEQQCKHDKKKSIHKHEHGCMHLPMQRPGLSTSFLKKKSISTSKQQCTSSTILCTVAHTWRVTKSGRARRGW